MTFNFPYEKFKSRLDQVDVRERQSLFERNKFGGVEKTINMVTEAINSNKPQESGTKKPPFGLLSRQRRQIKEDGFIRLPYKHFTLYYRKEDSEGYLSERPWTVCFHGIHPKEEQEAREVLEQGLLLRRISFVETKQIGCYELERVL